MKNNNKNYLSKFRLSIQEEANLPALTKPNDVDPKLLKRSIEFCC